MSIYDPLGLEIEHYYLRLLTWFVLDECAEDIEVVSKGEYLECLRKSSAGFTNKI